MKQTCLVLGAALVMAGDRLAAPTSGDIGNFFRVNAQVSTGGQPTREQLATLKAEGVRGIVNLREPEEHNIEEEATLAKDLGLHYISIPVKTAAPKDEQVETFLKVTNDPEIFPLFIHCASANRVGAFWMIRRILVDGWTPERAEAEAKQIGLKSPNLLDFARDYVHRHAKEAPGF
jgi:protein tyrosine phosphatase (PTP) superfamily phosphohydrolase (DUF442 family)